MSKKLGRLSCCNKELATQFKDENPETIGETDTTFDYGNYIEWLENKILSIVGVEWISVEDRLPEVGVTVLVSGGCAMVGHDGKWLSLMEQYEDGEYREIQWNVTHWRSLPRPPKEEA